MSRRAKMQAQIRHYINIELSVLPDLATIIQSICGVFKKRLTEYMKQDLVTGTPNSLWNISLMFAKLNLEYYLQRK